MSLKDEINNTNKQKENVKTVANKIDNKLVELGGEQAINLANVPNKINSLVKKYNKIAVLNIKKAIKVLEYNNNQITRITLNLKFTPKILLVEFYDRRVSSTFFLINTIHTKTKKYDNNSNFYFWINSVSQNEFEFAIGNDYSVDSKDYIDIKRVIAIG